MNYCVRFLHDIKFWKMFLQKEHTYFVMVISTLSRSSVAGLILLIILWMAENNEFSFLKFVAVVEIFY